MLLYNKGKLRKRRIELRQGATPHEVLLWSRLRMGKMGFKFRRQYSIGWYILDFYCPKKKLAIEIDGAQHKKSKAYDQERTNFLNAHGVTVLRFWDNEITNNMESVVQKIASMLCVSPPPC